MNNNTVSTQLNIDVNVTKKFKNLRPLTISKKLLEAKDNDLVYWALYVNKDGEEVKISLPIVNGRFVDESNVYELYVDLSGKFENMKGKDSFYYYGTPLKANKVCEFLSHASKSNFLDIIIYTRDNSGSEYCTGTIHSVSVNKVEYDASNGIYYLVNKSTSDNELVEMFINEL